MSTRFATVRSLHKPHTFAARPHALLRYPKGARQGPSAVGPAFRTVCRGKYWHYGAATGAVRTLDTTDRQVHEMANRSTAASIDEYIAGFPPETQEVLHELRGLIKASAPNATETISYAIPTFDLNGHLVHFAGYRNHIGFYPTSSGIGAFEEELTPYRSGKGSVQFPVGRPLPTDLIRRIVAFRVEENTRKVSNQGPRGST
jgi:uncharacterized protein YdhG (YjbR/CyaY superfamily)